MTSLIAVLSSGKGTWVQVSNLIAKGEWDRVYLICNDYAYKDFDVDPNRVVKLRIDENNPVKSLNILGNFFRKEIKDFEVALNMVSGTGLEHMTILMSILKAGLGIRMMYFENGSIHEMNIFDEKYSSNEYLGDDF